MVHLVLMGVGTWSRCTYTFVYSGTTYERGGIGQVFSRHVYDVCMYSVLSRRPETAIALSAYGVIANTYNRVGDPDPG